MKNVLLREVLRIARDKLETHPQRSCWPHTSAIVQNNSLIGMAPNTASEPQIFLGYHERMRWCDGEEKNGLPKLHSEVNVYKKVKGILNPSRPFEVINIRLSRSKATRISRPCQCCHNFLKIVGCAACYFSLDDDMFAKVII